LIVALKREEIIDHDDDLAEPVSTAVIQVKKSAGKWVGRGAR
jgi:hypothetical protein